MKLIHGDCLEIMPTIEAGSIDAILTDLPYGTTNCSWDEIIPFEPMWEAIKHVLKPNGVFVTTASQPFTSKLVMSNLGWFKYEWVWDKRNVTGAYYAKYQPMRQHENIVVFYASGSSVYNPQKEIIKKSDYRYRKNGRKHPERKGGVYGNQKEEIQKETGERNPSTIVTFINSNSKGKTHPTQKPVALYEYLIRTYTNKGETVLDMCMGSGTTGVACVRTGRDFVGIEIEKYYFDIAEKRIASAQPALF